MSITCLKEQTSEIGLKSFDVLWLQISGTLCNLSCAHCFLSCSPKNESLKFMTTEHVLNTVLHAGKLGVKEFYFTGGEPFLHPDIKEIIEYTLKACPLTILTNGTLFNEETVQWLKKAKENSPNPLELRISLDGFSREENDSIRGPGNFEKVVNSIKMLAKQGINPIITVTELYSDLSCPTLQDGFRKKLSEMGMENVRLKFMSPLHLGRESTRSRPYNEYEALKSSEVCSQKLETLQCSNCRAVTSEGVFPCPILVGHPDARMGDTLESGMSSIPLCYQACYTCYHQGLTCSNTVGTENGYLETAHELYKNAAINPNSSLCCVTSSRKSYRDLQVPDIMYEMNYGCGTTVHPDDIRSSDSVLYVGVGGGLEALQFAYATRRKNSVIVVDRVPEMLAKAKDNFFLAAEANEWFDPSFIRLLEGDALNLPVESERVDIAAQNCLFNIFKHQDLHRALGEMHRVLKPGGRLYMSDPITTAALPEHLIKDERLRAMCLSGALPFDEYIGAITEVGFGTVEVRSKRPYRVLDPERYGVEKPILLESLEIVAYKHPILEDGACVFIGETVIYTGNEEYFDDRKGHVMQRDVPLSICNKTANKLRQLRRNDLYVTEPTYCYAGGGCC